MTLPRGWVDATIEDVANYVSRGKSPKYVDRSNLPVVNQRAVRWSGVDSSRLKFVDPSTAHQWDENRTLKAGDLLWNSTGTGTIGRAALYHPLPGFDRVVADSHVTVVRVEPAIDPAYLFARIKSPAVQSVLDKMQSGSTNQVELNRTAVLATPVPLPPIAEQRRIVAKLDALTARLVHARAELYRVLVLARRLRESAVESILGSQAIPSGWRSFQLGDLAVEGPTNGWSPKSDGDAQGAQTLKLTATTSGRLRLDDGAVKRIHEMPPPDSRFWLRDGDLLIQRANALEHVGATAIYEGPSQTYIYPDLMMRLRFDSPALTRLVWYRLNSPTTRQYLRDRATGTAGNMPKISGVVVRQVPIALPEESLWGQAVRMLDAAFVRADRLEAEAARARALIDRLEAAILAKAFRGELVPQDPNDEAASVLLERIRAQRAAAPKTKRGRGAKAKA